MPVIDRHRGPPREPREHVGRQRCVAVAAGHESLQVSHARPGSARRPEGGCVYRHVQHGRQRMDADSAHRRSGLRLSGPRRGEEHRVAGGFFAQVRVDVARLSRSAQHVGDDVIQRPPRRGPGRPAVTKCFDLAVLVLERCAAVGPHELDQPDPVHRRVFQQAARHRIEPAQASGSVLARGPRQVLQTLDRRVHRFGNLLARALGQRRASHARFVASLLVGGDGGDGAQHRQTDAHRDRHCSP